MWVVYAAADDRFPAGCRLTLGQRSRLLHRAAAAASTLELFNRFSASVRLIKFLGWVLYSNRIGMSTKTRLELASLASDAGVNRVGSTRAKITIRERSESD